MSSDVQSGAVALNEVPKAGNVHLGLSAEKYRELLQNTLYQRKFIIPSFSIYGGVAGLYDYGPPGCAIKQNVLAFWRKVLFFSYVLASCSEELINF